MFFSNVQTYSNKCWTCPRCSPKLNLFHSLEQSNNALIHVQTPGQARDWPDRGQCAAALRTTIQPQWGRGQQWKQGVWDKTIVSPSPRVNLPRQKIRNDCQTITEPLNRLLNIPRSLTRQPITNLIEDFILSMESRDPKFLLLTPELSCFLRLFFFFSSSSFGGSSTKIRVLSLVRLVLLSARVWCEMLTFTWRMHLKRTMGAPLWNHYNFLYLGLICLL